MTDRFFISPFLGRKIFVVLIASIGIAAQSQTLEPSIKEAFLAGKTRLSLGFFNSAYTGVDETKKLLQEEKWEELVSNVLGKNFNNNLYYYLLGRAAEGMRSKSAAKTYYDLALVDNIKCSGYVFGDGCMGFSFPAVVSERYASLATPTQGMVRKWDIGAGPLISELISSKTLSVEELKNINPNQTASKGKFETDEEFAARGGAVFEKLFVVVKVSTDNEKKCKTSFDHKASTYKVNNCVVFSGLDPVLSKTGFGDSFSLANMIDKREIKRILTNNFYIDANFVWNVDFQMTREVASVVDEDLLAGIQFDSFKKTSKCEECESRDLQESSADLMDSIGKLTGKRVDSSDINWKKEAFRTGSVQESWIYRFSPEKVSKIVVFRKSDNRALYELIPE